MSENENVYNATKLGKGGVKINFKFFLFLRNMPTTLKHSFFNRFVFVEKMAQSRYFVKTELRNSYLCIIFWRIFFRFFVGLWGRDTSRSDPICIIIFNSNYQVFLITTTDKNSLCHRLQRTSTQTLNSFVEAD